MRPHTPEEVIGMGLGIACITLAFIVAVQILREIAAHIARDIRSWWRLRHPAKGWQPRRPSLVQRIAKALMSIVRRPR